MTFLSAEGKLTVDVMPGIIFCASVAACPPIPSTNGEATKTTLTCLFYIVVPKPSIKAGFDPKFKSRFFARAMLDLFRMPVIITAVKG